MHALTLEQFNDIAQQARIKPKLRRDVRFTASTSHMSVQDWNETELLAITDRSEHRGVLLMAPSDAVYVVAYELSSGIVSSTGQAQPIICDFCRTWQSGLRAGSISFQKDSHSNNRITFLCCADLRCSQHVRSLTSAARTSRAQLREHLTGEQRVERLKDRLKQIVMTMQLAPIPYEIDK